METPKSLGLLLKSRIETHYERVNEECPLFWKARQGTLTPSEVCEFLDNIFFLIQHTAIFLRIARRTCFDRDLNELAKFYNIKIEEEKGHERWAESDLDSLSKHFNVTPTRAVSPSMEKLVDCIRDSIHQDPTLYLAYIMLAEHFTVLSTPEWLSNLEKKCGIPSSALSVIGNHGELDKGHVHEMIETIDKLADKHIYTDSFVKLLDQQAGLHEAFCNEVTKTL